MRYPKFSFATVAAVVMLLVMAGAAEAQGRGKGRGFRVPPGHMPGPGMCRVWYPGVPPGHQPPAVPCFALRGYRFIGAVVVEGPPRGGRFAYWDEGWGGGGRFRVDFVFRSRDDWRRDGVRILAAYERGGVRFDDGDRDRDRDRDRRGRGRGR
jgi:hypothetical protein